MKGCAQGLALEKRLIKQLGIEMALCYDKVSCYKCLKVSYEFLTVWILRGPFHFMHTIKQDFFYAGRGKEI